MLMNSSSILDYKPERLMLTGYRGAMAGYDYGDSGAWDDMWTSLSQEAGTDFACRVTGSFHYLVRSLRASRPCAGSYYPKSCKRVCAVECLVLTLLSAQQHGDPEVEDYCMRCLVGDDAEGAGEDLAKAARLLADGFAAESYRLLPVPLPVIRSIAENASCITCPKRAVC